MDNQTKAILAHITLIGWIVALVLNQDPNKDEFTSFYLRQMLGLLIILAVLWVIPIIGWLISIILVVFWLLSLMGAARGEKKLTPLVGSYFQEWFKSI